METRVNLAVVGAFVLVLSAAGIGGLLWLGSGRLSQRAYDTYVASFSDSVSGLTDRAPVKLRGVDVGTVQEIALDPTDPARVRVVLALDRGTPVKEDTYATLGVQGLTGIAYVELGGGTRTAAPLRAAPGEPYPVLRTRPSLFTRLDVATTTLIADLDRATHGVNETLDPETREALRASARDLARILHTVAARSREIDAASLASVEMLRNGARASAALPGLVERLSRSAAALERMGTELAEAGVAAQAAFREARGGLGQAGEGMTRFQAEVVPEVQRLVSDLRETTASVGRLTAELERDPSALVVGRAPLAPGPGE